MDLLNLATEGYKAYSEAEGQQVQGGAQFNAPHQQGGHQAPQIDHDQVVQQAHAKGSGDTSLFSSAVGFLGQNKHEHTKPVDEEAVQRAHKAAYSQDSASSLDADGMGSAAALQALKMFTASSGGGDQNELMSLAMSEASTLFEQSGGASSGSKQDVVNSAAMTVMKFMVQSKFSSMMGGGNSGGMGGLLGMASKFL